MQWLSFFLTCIVSIQAFIKNVKKKRNNYYFNSVSVYKTKYDKDAVLKDYGHDKSRKKKM